MTREVWVSAALWLLFGSIARAEPGTVDDWALSRPAAPGVRGRAEESPSARGIAQVERAAARGERAALAQAIARYLAGAVERARAEVMVARVLAAHGLVTEALSHAERACVLAPRSREARRTLAQLLERARRLEEASAAWEVVATLSAGASEVREARQHLVSVWARGGVLDERTHVLERRHADDPADRSAALLLVEIHARASGQRGRAVTLLEQLAEARADDLDVLRMLAALRASTGPSHEALASFERVVLQRAASCDDAVDALKLAVAHAEADAARRIAVRAGERCRAEARVQRLVGAVLRARGERAAARSAEERAIALEPADWETRLVLAEDALARGARREAVSRLRAAVLTARDDAGIEAAASQLGGLDADVLEAVLVERAREPAVRHVAVRLLMEHYRDSLVAREGGGSGGLREVVARAVPVLGLALASEQAYVRAVALDLLEAAPAERAAASLLALAARGDALASERAQALAALGKLRLAGLGARLRRLDLPPALRPMRLWAIAACEGRAAEGLLRSAARGRDAAAAAVAIVELMRLGRPYFPDPAVPLDLAGYVEMLARVGVGDPGEWSGAAWRGLGSLAARELAAGGARAARVLGVLVGVEGGVWPRAFVALGRCADRERARQLGDAVREPLRALVRDDVERASQALVLLVQSGALELPEVMAALRGQAVRARTAVLDALAARDEVPSALAPVLAEVLVSAPDWPTRMRAARALAGAPHVAVRDDEPVGLVRAALATARVRGGGRCVPARRGLAN